LGRHAIAFAQAGFSVTATDTSTEAIVHLSNRALELSLDIRGLVCDGVSDDFPPESFHIVLAYNVIYHGYRDEFAGAIGNVHKLLKPNGLFYFTCPTRDDGKYGFGKEVAPHTYLCEKSITPGDMHYFPNKRDLKNLLSDFSLIQTEKNEGYWDNKGTQQFYSNWHVLAKR
jgi:SAM-dependent methyltransferase